MRTDTAKKHEGISFLLIDMTAPGVEVRPILLINGTSPFCETFFTDVDVPKDQLFGPLNGGWTVAKRLLQFERDNISAGLGGGNIGQTGGPALTVVEAAKSYVGLEDDGRLADADLRRQVHRAHDGEPRLPAHSAARRQDEAKSNGPSNAAAIMKYAGPRSPRNATNCWSRPWARSGPGLDRRGLFRGRVAGRADLAALQGQFDRGRHLEINLNVVSREVLGLPDPK